MRCRFESGPRYLLAFGRSNVVEDSFDGDRIVKPLLNARPVDAQQVDRQADGKAHAIRF